MNHFKKFCSTMILPLWIVAGVAIGVALDNLAVGIGIGVAIGAALTITKKQKQSNADASGAGGTNKDAGTEVSNDSTADGSAD